MRFWILLFCCHSMFTQAPPNIKIRADFVKVPVSVFGPEGRPLSGLRRENFQLLDENEPRPIANFVLDKSPLHVVLLLDVSGSTRDELEEFKDAALQFARSFSKEDRIALMSFADELVLLQDWTSRPGEIRKSLGRIERGYRTALYDALVSAVRTKLNRIHGKKVIIVLTDGLDNESRATYEQALTSLIQADTSLYVVSRTRIVRSQIGKGDRVDFLNQVMKNVLHEDEDFVGAYFQEKEAALSNLAEATGGRVLFPEKLEDLKNSYVRITEELKSQYLLTFEPPPSSDKEFRTIRVICSESVGRLYHRTQYAYRR